MTNHTVFFKKKFEIVIYLQQNLSSYQIIKKQKTRKLHNKITKW